MQLALTFASTLTFFAFTQRPSSVRVEELGESSRFRLIPLKAEEGEGEILDRVEDENKQINTWIVGPGI